MLSDGDMVQEDVLLPWIQKVKDGSTPPTSRFCCCLFSFVLNESFYKSTDRL